MKKIITGIVLVLLAAFVSTGHAQVRGGTYSLTPFIGGYTFEGNEDLKSGLVYGLRGGYNFTKKLGVEGFFNYMPTEIESLVGNPDVKLYGFGIEGLYHFMPDNRLVPFVALGVGGNRYSASGGINDRDRFTVDYGAGLKYFMKDNLALRADIRHVIIPLNDRHNELLYTVGVDFVFGGAKKALPEVVATGAVRAAEPEAAPVVVMDSDGDGVVDSLDKCPGTPAGVTVDKDGCPLDSDKDGVYDYLDKCPGTPIGVKVDKDGCPLDSDKDGVYDYIDKCPGTPIGVKVDQDGCPLDTDKDGVYDYLDKCPGTPVGVKVDQDGCPLDTDKDGVYDYLDKCPGTPVGVKVDQDGCPLDSDKDGVPDYLDKCPGTPLGVKVDQDGCPPPVVQKVVRQAAAAMEAAIVEKGRVTLNVEFDTNKATIRKSSHKEISNLAEVMKKQADLKIQIEGHTDNIGAAKYNEKLSQLRADAVKKYLVEKFGIDASRLTAKGYGLTKPIASNATKEGRQKNRRVEAATEYIIKK